MDGSAEPRPRDLTSCRGDIALIGLNRPDKRNAISDRVVEALAGPSTARPDEAKAAVICGHGPHFCAGLDLAEHVEEAADRRASRARAAGTGSSTGIERGTIPFVAALHGAVVGGGFELAASTHIRVADETAFFALPEGSAASSSAAADRSASPRLIGARA